MAKMKFTKSDLITGDVVINSKGSLGVVLKGSPFGDLIKWIVNRKEEEIHKYRPFMFINEDLTFFENTEHRIVKVMRPTDPHDVLRFSENDDIVYEEEETMKLTMSDLEEMMGCKVVIVAEDDDEDDCCECGHCCGQ